MANNAHQPTDTTRKIVEEMSAYGIPQLSIAKSIGVSINTLSKYYGDELENAAARAVHQVANMLFQKCMEGDTTSIIFFLKTRGKWREKDDDDRDKDKDKSEIKIVIERD